MKKIKALVSVLLVIALALVVFAACGNNNTPTEKINLAVLKGPTGLGALQLIENAEDYNVQICAAPTEVTGLLTSTASGAVDIAALPLNMAANIYNKTSGGVVMLNAMTLGVLYILERGDTISSIADLKGKTIYASARGSSTEFVLNYLLKENNLDIEKDLTIEWVADHAALSALLLAGDADIALLPEPNVSTALSKDETLRVAIDLNQAWTDATQGSKLVMSAIVARKEFAENNPELIEKFISDYSASVNFANNNLTQAGELAEKHGFIPNSALAEIVIPRSQLVCITGNDMKTLANSNLNVLFEADAQSVGGKVPDDGFYYGLS